MTRSHRRGVAAMATLALGLTLLLAATPAAGARAADGPRAHATVVGGGLANSADWPFVVAVYRKDRLHCGGSIIAPTKVLTAAHCVEGFNLSHFTVVVARPDLRNTTVGTSIAIAGGVTHPDFITTAQHDMAVLTLAQATTAPAVTLATAAEDPSLTLLGAPLNVAGWGAQNPLGLRLSSVLKQTTETVRGTRRCLRAYSRDLFDPATMICALGSRLGRFKRPPIHTSACSGDSGGPLVAPTAAGPRQVGIVSFGGAFCGLPSAPTVYARVSSGLDFIASAG